MAEQLLRELIMSEVKELIKTQTPEDPVLFLHGGAGIGKTSVTDQVAMEQKMAMIKFDAAMRDPSDIRGIFFVVDGKAKYITPDDLPQEARDGQKGIFFCDELLFAVPAVQNVLHSLIQDKQFGNYKLPPRWIVIAASNRTIDRAQIFEMSGPLANRFAHIHCLPDYDTWANEWAVNADIDPLIISFFKLHPQYFCQEPVDEISFATPRSIANASRYLNKNLPEKFKRAAIAGCVGAGVESEIHAHRTIGKEAQDIIDGIIAGKHPDYNSLNVSLLWVISVYFGVNLKNKFKSYAKPLCEYALRVGEYHQEMAIHTAKLAVSSSASKITREPLWVDVAKKYSGLIS